MSYKLMIPKLRPGFERHKKITAKQAKMRLLQLQGKRIDILRYKGHILDVIGEWDKSHQIREVTLKLAQSLDDARRLAYANQGLGIILEQKGERETALTYFNRAFDIFQKLNDLYGMAMSLDTIGSWYKHEGDFDRARDYYDQALAWVEKIGHKRAICIQTGNIAMLHAVMGDYEQAHLHNKQSLKLAEEAGSKRLIAVNLGNLAVIHYHKGDIKRALAFDLQALARFEEMGHKAEIAIGLGNIGGHYQELGEYEQARAYYERAIVLRREIGMWYNLCCTLIDKAELLFLKQQYDMAQAPCTEGLAIANQVRRGDVIFRSKVLQAKINLTGFGNPSGLVTLEQMLAETSDPEQQATLHYELWQLLNKFPNLRDLENLNAHHQAALSLYQKLLEKTPKFEYKKRIEELQSSMG